MTLSFRQFWLSPLRSEAKSWLAHSFSWAGGVTLIIGFLMLLVDWPGQAKTIFPALCGLFSFVAVLVISAGRDLAWHPYAVYRASDEERRRLHLTLQPKISVRLPDEPVGSLRQGSTVETLGATLYSAVTNWVPTAVSFICQNDGALPLLGVSAKVVRFSVDGVASPLMDAIPLSATPRGDEELVVDLSPGEAKRFWLGRATHAGAFFLLRNRAHLIFDHQRAFSENPGHIEIEVLVSAPGTAGTIAVFSVATAPDDRTGDGIRMGKVSAELLGSRPAVA
ncbi:hypothetical protein [Paracoccus rhizosphaerae]|uniref:Uncharacterized protein n=1 Tax=Paracoccus rhizosphaerae TaxID=1133347 RepID=A0ABV6CHF3_9RHOB|nr:hypothetical protein [Paracoccus rhizosphaerae]